MLVPLGVDATSSASTFAVWHEFGVSAVDRDHPAARGLHVVFAAPSREQVDEFWATAVEGDGQAASAPTALPGGGVAAVVRDPWGNLTEPRFDPKAPNRHGSIVSPTCAWPAPTPTGPAPSPWWMRTATTSSGSTPARGADRDGDRQRDPGRVDPGARS